MIKKMTFLLVFLVYVTHLSAQDRVISGKITEENGASLPGATVMLKGTNKGVVTDVDGNYQLSVPQEGGILQFSYVGYTAQELQIGSENTMNVNLSADVKSLNEVVVIGYGIQKKSLVTGAISSLKSDDIQNTSISRTSEALQGKTSGVTVIPNSGSPGANISVRIRGVGSNGKSDPLYIVDGMKTDNINFIDPGDIQSMEVLKDAASSAIYGTEGANGVVIITTKSGKEGSSEINYNFEYGSQSAPKLPEMMNAEEYSQYVTDAGVAGDIPNPSDYKGVKGTNWLDETFQNAPMQKHHLSFSGSNEKFTYMASGSYLTQDGIVGGDKSNFNRYTARLNATHKTKDWLEIGTNISYSNTKRNSISEDSEFGSVIGSALAMDPITPVVFEGNLPQYAQDVLDEGSTLIKNGEGKYYGISQYVGAEIGNPLAMLEIQKGKDATDMFLGSFNAKISPFKGFSFTSRAGIDLSITNSHVWSPKFYWSGERNNSQLSKSMNSSRNQKLMWENFASYNFAIDKHDITFMAGMSAEESEYLYINTKSNGMFKEADEFAYHGDVDVDGIVSGNISKSRMNSYFGRLSYNYAGKYMFESTLRSDGSSMFAPENARATFPSVSAGWVISEESFIPKTLVTFLKLRASWGQNGSISNIGPDQWKSLITSEGIKYPIPGGGFLPGAEVSVISNPSLKWETSEQTDIGIDARFFNNKLSVTADYYIKLTKDLLTPGFGPLSAGNKFPDVNGGDVENKGFEFELGWKEKESEFKYSANINFAILSNKVTRLEGKGKMPGATIGTTGSYATMFEAGQPIWYLRGYKTLGIFQNQTQIDNYISTHNITEYEPGPEPGDPIVSDENKDGKINEDDMVKIGNPHPDYIVGANLNFEYKGFDLGIFLQASIGNDVMMGFFRTDRGTFNKPKFFYTDRWTEKNKTNSWFRPNSSSAFIYNSDLMVSDASYLRVKQIQLGYTFSKTFLSRLNVKSLRAFVSLDDYFTFTKYKGIDPEAGSTQNDNSIGIDRGLYPIPRKLMAGFSVSF